jgi:sporulation protein YlmC with PRC-barrel domain
MTPEMKEANRFAAIVAAIAAAILAVGVATQERQPVEAENPSPEPEHFASDLIGRPVHTANGQAVGRIADLVLSPKNEVTAAVVVSVGGFLNLDDRRLEVPYDRLVVGADSGAVVVMMSDNEIVAAPELEPKKAGTFYGERSMSRLNALPAGSSRTRP